MKDIEQSYDLAHLKAKIAEIYESLSEAKMALVDAKEEIAELEIEIARLKQMVDDRSDLIAGDGGYKYAVGDNSHPLGFPVCPKCDQIDGRLIHLVQDGDVKQAKCPACATLFNPVTCYLPGGDTLVAVRDRRRKAMQEESSRKLFDSYDRLNRGYP